MGRVEPWDDRSLTHDYLKKLNKLRKEILSKPVFELQLTDKMYTTMNYIDSV